MRLLALDTIGPTLTAAALWGDALVAERAETGAHDRAERVLPLIEATRRAAGWAWGELDLLAVCVGPGSFSAVRLGISVVRALALAISRQVVAVNALEALAEAAGPGAHVTALLDARRGAVFVQEFDTELSPVSVPRNVGLEALRGMAANRRVAADAALLEAAAIAPSWRVEAAPSARYVARRARRRLMAGERPVTGTMLEPFYPRGPDARPDAGRPLVAVTG